jgi:hypothetical protein
MFREHARKILTEHLSGKKLNNEALQWAIKWSYETSDKPETHQGNGDAARRP